jgi:hypothetical protein
MNIVRKGSQRNRGSRTLVKGLVLKSRSGRPWSDSLAWNSDSNELVIQVRNVPSQDGKSHHDYTHRITLVDFAEMIDLAAHSGGKSSAKHLRDALSGKVLAITKLLACATGFQPQEIQDCPDEI